jgi:hypothetical protein
MPDFYVTAAGAPTLENRVWEDPASASLPSRLTGINDRQHRRLVAQQGTVLTLLAALEGDSGTHPDTVVGLFTMWPIEWPTDAGQPAQSIPLPGMSAIQRFVLNGRGHYTFGVRHENTQDAPNAAAGGVVVFHVDVEGSA